MPPTTLASVSLSAANERVRVARSRADGLTARRMWGALSRPRAQRWESPVSGAVHAVRVLSVSRSGASPAQRSHLARDAACLCVAAAKTATSRPSRRVHPQGLGSFPSWSMTAFTVSRKSSRVAHLTHRLSRSRRVMHGVCHVCAVRRSLSEDGSAPRELGPISRPSGTSRQ